MMLWPGKDQKLGDWMSMTDIRSQVPDGHSVKTPELSVPAWAYFNNTTQALDLSGFSWQMCHLGARLRNAEIAANLSKFNDPSGQCRGSVSGKDMDELADLVSRFMNDPSGSPLPMAGFTVLSSVSLERYVTAQTQSMYGTIMSSQLILSWSAFETLANDLWKEAVNAHPGTLALMKAKKEKGISNQKAENEKQKIEQEKRETTLVPMWLIERHGFDVSKCIGNILAVKYGGMRSLDEIADRYVSTFPRGCIAGNIEFWNDEHIRASSAVRNLLIHKAGKVDKEFKEQRGKYAELACCDIDDQLFIDGKLVSDLIRGMVAFTKRLIVAVDEWIVNNPV
jgi:hypothetical protein